MKLLAAILMISALITPVFADESPPPDDPPFVDWNDFGDGGEHACGYDIVVVNRTQGIIVFSAVGGVLVILTVVALINSAGVKVDSEDGSSKSGKKQKKKKAKSKKKSRK
jgi:hypothetical protein